MRVLLALSCSLVLVPVGSVAVWCMHCIKCALTAQPQNHPDFVALDGSLHQNSVSRLDRVSYSLGEKESV